MCSSAPKRENCTSLPILLSGLRGWLRSRPFGLWASRAALALGGDTIAALLVAGMRSRAIHQKNYSKYIGVSENITPARLEQVAAQFQAYLK
jgi:hypothetical protein